MRWIVVPLMLLAAGCTETKSASSIVVQFDNDLHKGTVTMTCRESSSGTCYALFAVKDDVQRLEVKQGEAASATGVNDFTQYCLDVTAPADGCDLKPLTEGQQIVRRRRSAKG